jgi:hypothetical protein
VNPTPTETSTQTSIPTQTWFIRPSCTPERCSRWQIPEQHLRREREGPPAHRYTSRQRVLFPPATLTHSTRDSKARSCGTRLPLPACPVSHSRTAVPAGADSGSQPVWMVREGIEGLSSWGASGVPVVRWYYFFTSVTPPRYKRSGGRVRPVLHDLSLRARGPRRRRFAACSMRG